MIDGFQRGYERGARDVETLANAGTNLTKNKVRKSAIQMNRYGERGLSSLYSPLKVTIGGGKKIRLSMKSWIHKP